MDIHDLLNDSNPVRQLINCATVELQPISSDPFTAIRRDFRMMVSQVVSKLNEYLAADLFQQSHPVLWLDKTIKKDPRAGFGLKQPIEPFYRSLVNHDRTWKAQMDQSEIRKLQSRIPTHHPADVLFFNHLFGAAHTLDELAYLASTTTPLDMQLAIRQYMRQQAVFAYLEGAGRSLWATYSHPENQFFWFQQAARDFVENRIPITVHNIATLIAAVFFADYNLNTVISLWYTDQPITGQDLKPYL